MPKQITTPIDRQSASPLIIIGKTPNAVVQEVRKIGRIRRLPASIAASFALRPCCICNSSAYSNMMMPLRTMMPTRLMSPNTAVSPKSRLKIQSPKNAPNMHSRLSVSVSAANEIFLKWNSMKKNNTATAQMNDSRISGITVLLTADSPPYSTVASGGSSGKTESVTKRWSSAMATGWLQPCFISASTVTDALPALCGRLVTFQSG